MMPTSPRVATGRGVLAAAALVALLIGSSALEHGCAKRKQRRAERRAMRAAEARSEQIVLDGRLNEWPENIAALADGDYLYFRVTLPEEITLQAAAEPVTLLVDLDADAGTGTTLSSPLAAAGLGFDLGVQFSPQDGRGGVAAFQMDPSGAHVPVPSSQIGLQFAPTHSATDFEVRLSRHPDSQAPGALASALSQAGPAKVMITLQDQGGTTVGWSDAETFTKPPVSGGPARADREAPAKPDGALRVVTWNVHRSSPMSNPGPFARVLQVLDADVILVQEWDDADAPTLAAWFTAVVSGEKSWSTRVSEGGARGVAIISPHPISAIGLDRLMVEESGGGEGSGEPVRWVAGVVQTPGGNLGVASVHLKCCGGSGTPEDLRRVAEALVINGAMRDAFEQSGATVRVIAGDVNLVGSRAPLDALRSGLDGDGSDLETAGAFVLGDRAMDTWADATTQFTPGRLDYTLFGESGAEMIHAFALDTSRLSDAALARMGLDRADTDASDHRPVVIDLRPR